MARTILGSNRRGGGRSLVDLYTQAQEEARASNLSREQEIRSLLKQNLETYGPEGAFAKSGERAIEQTYAQDVSRMIGAGLYGTTAVESTAGAARRSGRLTLESMLEEGKSRARSDYAGFIERIQDEYPDLGGLTQAYASGASVPSMSGTSPSTRPGWAIGYGAEPLSRVPAVEATTPTREVAPSIGRSAVYGPSATVPTAKATSGDTLSKLFAEGRATVPTYKDIVPFDVLEPLNLSGLNFPSTAPVSTDTPKQIAEKYSSYIKSNKAIDFNEWYKNIYKK
uniref:Uncharacterized protein n=1 Tax=viral metagenome TaxID=1070528 RepID=A0A6M3J1J2_9ZZZZ